MKNTKSVNKHIFVWVANFLFGFIGVDRFMRGQTGLGVLKLLTGGVFGIMWLVDSLISLKVYSEEYDKSSYVYFDEKGEFAPAPKK